MFMDANIFLVSLFTALIFVSFQWRYPIRGFAQNLIQKNCFLIPPYNRGLRCLTVPVGLIKFLEDFILQEDVLPEPESTVSACKDLSKF